MLEDSRLYSFMDRENNFTVHFLEGQKLIHDLAIIHNVKGQGFSYFRDTVLTAQNLVTLLKPGEGLGLFIDSEDPYFRLKIEMNHAGRMRTLILPETFNESPKEITGVCRLSKIFPNNSTPYTSVIDLNKSQFTQVVNSILKDSYQMKSEIHVSQDSDQSMMLVQLPPVKVDKEEIIEPMNIKEYWMKIQATVNELFSKSTTEQSIIQKSFEDLGLTFLGSKLIEFKCNCSRERMLASIGSLCQASSIEEVFEGDENIESKCDYCKTFYLITKDDVINYSLQ
ncbi:Hsp33 family molecular chaperone HslO [Halobacteriovorax sp. HLS]|uniref:Hsp33 family molecular chaperone HslO n=1 Tax=Halobacteriovorax sp. HLS TaxID=2234000 RepID=UPI000FD82CCA|nr:Hsp33 family molecular chaperone HslO [Halobacteriovorax sp. HLS]